MPYQLLADLVVVVHLLFILFVVFGGLLLLRWARLVWLHVTAVSWGIITEACGWICPLTPLENWLRRQSIDAGSYQAGFVEHYLLPVIYPRELTREFQWLLAFAVLVVNLLIYGTVCYIRKKR